MPIPIENINRNFLVVTTITSVGDVCDQAIQIGYDWLYVVVQGDSGKFAVLRLGEIIQFLKQLREPNLVLQETLVKALDISPDSFASPLDQRSTGRDEAQRMVNATRSKRLVVTSENQVIGVYAIEVRSGGVTPDVDWLEHLLFKPLPFPGSAGVFPHAPERDLDPQSSIPSPAPPYPAAPSPAPPYPAAPSPASPYPAAPSPVPPYPSAPSPSAPGGSDLFDRLPGVPYPSAPLPRAPVPPAPPPPPSPQPAGGGVLSVTEQKSGESRWINAEILDHPPAQPIKVGEVYTLAFDVDTQARSSSLASAAFTYLFAPAEELVELTVQLSSSDFTIHTEPQKLRVPRTGKSKGRARFDIEPNHNGKGVISAVFLKDGNFIQLLTLELDVGKTAEIQSVAMSRPLEAAFDVQPRDLGLVITNTGTAFKLILTGPVYAEATLPLTLPELDQLIGEVRVALKQVVNLEEGPDRKRAYQWGIDISEQSNRLALKHLAETGYLLFQRMFYGDAADAQAKLLGDKLIEMTEKQKLKIQIVSQQFLLPWGMLYLAQDFDPNNIDPERFLGFKHIIEHIPLQPSMQVVDSVIKSQPKLTVSINVNSEIDQQMGLPLIAEQLKYWKKISDDGATEVIVRQSGQEIEQALAESSSAEQIFYFYCHAVSRGLAEGGPEASSLQFAGRGLTLRDLKLRAPTKKSLAGSPLVFINACESAELSPLFYGGFVPYFMAKGARGVIGTECETPALFAREWARRFFESFLGGESLGQVFLDLRREFFYQHNNVMGLLYAVYCDGDTRVVPGIEMSDTL